QHSRRDLPGKAPLVLAPSTGALRAAVLGDGVPVAIGFFLVFRDDHEADRLIRLEIWTTVESDERPAQHCEFHGELLAFLAVRELGWRRMARADLAVRENGSIELGRLAGLAFVEPEAGRESIVCHFF